MKNLYSDMLVKLLSLLVVIYVISACTIDTSQSQEASDNLQRTAIDLQKAYVRLCDNPSADCDWTKYHEYKKNIEESEKQRLEAIPKPVLKEIPEVERIWKEYNIDKDISPSNPYNDYDDARAQGITVEELQAKRAQFAPIGRVAVAASYANDASVCDYIMEVGGTQEQTESCKHSVYLKTKDSVGCLTLKSENWRDSCLDNVARATNKPQLCKSIETKAFKDSCNGFFDTQKEHTKGFDSKIDEGDNTNMPEFIAVHDLSKKFGDNYGITYWAKNFEITSINYGLLYGAEIQIKFKDDHTKTIKVRNPSIKMMFKEDIFNSVCQSNPACGDIAWLYQHPSKDDDDTAFYCPTTIERCQTFLDELIKDYRPDLITQSHEDKIREYVTEGTGSTGLAYDYDVKFVEFIPPERTYNEQGSGTLSPAYIIYETKDGVKKKVQTDNTNNHHPYAEIRSFCFSSVPYEHGGGWHYEEQCSGTTWIMYFPPNDDRNVAVLNGGYCPITEKVCKEISDLIKEQYGSNLW